ncbi:HNH endonuclease [Streptomyces murinus]|uniref:HNH endonuclease n=1 Tax=Streptomyces murinus TaxID=33900 RepID=UPI003D6693EF
MDRRRRHLNRALPRAVAPASDDPLRPLEEPRGDPGHGGRHWTRTRLLRCALCEVGVPERCAECGTGSEWLGEPMALEVDHIDGDWSDNRRENLWLLCPNCHTATSTWCRGGLRGHTHSR